MLKGNVLLDEMAKLAGNAAGSVLEVKRELEQLVQEKVDQWLARHGVVTREEFEIVREMATRAREETVRLRAESDALRSQSPSSGA